MRLCASQNIERYGVDMKQVKQIFYLAAVIIGVAVLTLLGTAVIQFGMAAAFAAIGITIDEDMLYSISGSIGIGVAAFMLWEIIRKKRNWKFLEEKETFDSGRAAAYAVLAVCVCKIIYNVLTTFLFSGILPMVTEAGRTEAPFIMQILLSVIWAPLTEEILFRKGIHSLLRRKYNSVTAIAINAIIFAAVHGYQLQGFLSCLLAGVVFTVLYERTGIIWYSVFAHMLCNLETAISALVEKNNITLFGTPLIYSINGYSTYHIVVFAVAIVLCAVIIRKLKRGDKCVSDTCSG